MDISKNYILLCKAAKEIQDTWIIFKGEDSWKASEAGDFYVGKYHHCLNSSFYKQFEDEFKKRGYSWRETMNCQSGEDYIGITDNDGIINYKLNCGDLIYSEIFWLPRQDQLQEMISYSFLSQLVQDFSDWCSEYNYWDGIEEKLVGIMIESLGPLSMEKLWLMFVMHKNYNKLWNGKIWKED